MDRNRTDRIGDGGLARSTDAEGTVAWISLASRRSGFARVRAGLFEGSRGPVLITGEGGAGKTWLWTRVVRSLPTNWRSVMVDLTSGLSPAEFLLLAGDGLGFEVSAGLGASRLQLAAALRDEAADGRSWVLIVEDAHHAPADVWEEIRVLSNRLGQADGFAALVIVAQTELVRRLTGREFASVAGRIADHVHLPPLDLDECKALIQGSAVRRHAGPQADAIEVIQRDARGNCREVLRLARRNSGRADRSPAELPDLGQDDVLTRRPVSSRARRRTDAVATAGPGQAVADGRSRPASSRTPPRPNVSLVPSRPPLRLEEGLIEVGWRGDSASPPGRVVAAAADSGPFLSDPVWSGPDPLISMPTDPPGPAEVSIGDERTDEPAEEWLEDPYAALQAWSEWARNRERVSESRSNPAESGEDFDPSGDRSGSGPAAVGSAASPHDESDVESSAGANAGATVRAEAQHDFSPFGRLFTEVRKSKQP